jgi:hypothetical protein
LKTQNRGKNEKSLAHASGRDGHKVCHLCQKLVLVKKIKETAPTISAPIIGAPIIGAPIQRLKKLHTICLEEGDEGTTDHATFLLFEPVVTTQVEVKPSSIIQHVFSTCFIFPFPCIKIIVRIEGK